MATAVHDLAAAAFFEAGVQPGARTSSGTGAIEELLDNFENKPALAVLGPDPFGEPAARRTVLIHPGKHATAGDLLATSSDFGPSWRNARGSPVGWETLDRQRASSEWREQWHSRGFRSFVRVEIPLPLDRAFECFLFTCDELKDSAEAARLGWWIMGSWHDIRDEIQYKQSPLSEREAQCLRLAFRGFTAGETAAEMNIPERRVNSTYQQAMEKLQCSNKVAAIHRACWLGVI